MDNSEYANDINNDDQPMPSSPSTHPPENVPAEASGITVMRQTLANYQLPAFGPPLSEPDSQRIDSNADSHLRDDDIQRLRRENAEMKEKITCICCEVSVVSVVILRCCHLRLCRPCSADMLVCPACAQDVKYMLLAKF